jgi:hypothetical protein
MSAVFLLEPIMGKKPPSPPPDDASKEPESETARIAVDLLEMIREMCFFTRDSRNKRMKIAQMIDGYLRPNVLRDYGKFKKDHPDPTDKR